MPSSSSSLVLSRLLSTRKSSQSFPAFLELNGNNRHNNNNNNGGNNDGNINNNNEEYVQLKRVSLPQQRRSHVEDSATVTVIRRRCKRQQGNRERKRTCKIVGIDQGTDDTKRKPTLSHDTEEGINDTSRTSEQTDLFNNDPILHPSMTGNAIATDTTCLCSDATVNTSIAVGCITNTIEGPIMTSTPKRTEVSKALQPLLQQQSSTTPLQTIDADIIAVSSNCATKYPTFRHKRSRSYSSSSTSNDKTKSLKLKLKLFSNTNTGSAKWAANDDGSEYQRSSTFDTQGCASSTRTRRFPSLSPLEDDLASKTEPTVQCSSKKGKQMPVSRVGTIYEFVII